MKHIFLFLSLVVTSTITYAMKLQKTHFKNTEIYFVNFDPKKHDMQIVRALDGGIGKEDVLSIAKRHRAIAAINGSFWEAGGKLNGIPAFMLKAGKDLFVRKSHPDILGVNDAQKLQADIISDPIAYFSKSGNVTFTKIHTSPHMIIGSKKIDCAINMPQINAPVMVYTRAYARSTLSNPGTFEATVIDNKIIHISFDGNSIIPENGFVLSSKSLKAHIGEKVLLDTTIPAEILNADYIMSGSNMLLANGELDEYLSDPKHKSAFRDTKHARSALCKMNNGNIAFAATDYVYENDIKNMVPKQILSFLNSNGITHEEAEKMSISDIMTFYHKVSETQHKAKGLTMGDFAAALKEHGCVDAINLDGGSSTTLVYKDKVIAGKRPKLQEDADAIIVRARKF